MINKHRLGSYCQNAGLIGATLLLLGLTGCSGNPSTNSGGSGAVPSFGIETTYCPGPTTISDGTTINSSASFNRYEDGATGLVATANYPIRYAEIEILNSAGTLIQCGETDGNGNISIAVPKVAGSYTLRVNSRSNSSYYKASVLNNPTEKSFYSVVSSFSLTGVESSKSVTLTPAPYNGTLEGGAFNILDQIYIANEYLRNNSTCSGCTTFTVAPKIEIFWTKGLSPGAYFDDPTVGISFFSKYAGGSIERGLYILGGIQGSVCNDTDHFDNSVILHEYGHFLENAYAKSSSPGGSHNGNGVIDPRLAWSEGWADFVQAAMLGRKFYRDTHGNAECGNPSLSFTDFNLENKSVTDVPVTAGEGIFREISVARTLYDTIDTIANDTDSKYASVDFSLLWHAFSNQVNGFGASSTAFQNSGLLHEHLASLVATHAPSSATAYADVLNYEYQSASEQYYGLNLSPQTGATCTFNFAAGTVVAKTTTSAHLHRSNKFFDYYYDGSAANAVITLRYSGATPYDLDLYTYEEDYAFDDASTYVGVSARSYPESGSGVETISLGGRPPGHYLINVRANYASAKSTTTLYLENSSGDRLCP